MSVCCARETGSARALSPPPLARSGGSRARRRSSASHASVTNNRRYAPDVTTYYLLFRNTLSEQRVIPPVLFYIFVAPIKTLIYAVYKKNHPIFRYRMNLLMNNRILEGYFFPIATKFSSVKNYLSDTKKNQSFSQLCSIIFNCLVSLINPPLVGTGARVVHARRPRAPFFHWVSDTPAARAPVPYPMRYRSDVLAPHQVWYNKTFSLYTLTVQVCV